MDVAAPRTPGGDWSQFCFTPCEQGRCPLGAELCSLVWGCPEYLCGVCLGTDYLCRWKAGLASMGWLLSQAPQQDLELVVPPWQLGDSLAPWGWCWAAWSCCPEITPFMHQ